MNSIFIRAFGLLVLLTALNRIDFCFGGETIDVVGKTFHAKDTLKPKNEDSADAKACLDELTWKPSEFEVTCEKAVERRYDALVRFPSAIDSGDPINDRVAVEWHMARDENGEIVKAPAIVVVHESGAGMAVGKVFAFGLSKYKLHAFMVQLPGYGVRKNEAKPRDAATMLRMTRQSIADVRRARDAISALPNVDTAHIALQGTSLGGFVSATTAGVDDGFDSVFIMLAGGNLFEVIQKGDRDAAKLRERLYRDGLDDEKIKEILHGVEPNRLAHRLPRNATWLFSGIKDTVVPLENAKSLAKAASLESSHHILMDVDHYSGVVHLPKMIRRVRDEIYHLEGWEIPPAIGDE